MKPFLRECEGGEGSLSSQCGATPPASDKEESERELTFFLIERAFQEGMLGNPARFVSQRQESLPCEKRGGREGKTIRRDGAGSDGKTAHGGEDTGRVVSVASPV